LGLFQRLLKILEGLELELLFWGGEVNPSLETHRILVASGVVNNLLGVLTSSLVLIAMPEEG
jgi:hypothetical protein